MVSMSRIPGRRNSSRRVRIGSWGHLLLGNLDGDFTPAASLPRYYSLFRGDEVEARVRQPVAAVTLMWEVRVRWPTPMSAMPAEMPVGQPAATRKWSRRRMVSVVTAIVACAVVAGLLLPTAITSWAPVLHWTCAQGSELTSFYSPVPFLALNSPYGGNVGGNVTTAPSYIDRGFTDSDGTTASNGEATSVGYNGNLTVFSDSNRTVLGPGVNVRCSQPFDVQFAPNGGGFGGLEIMGPGNQSDVNEPHTIFPNIPRYTTVESSNGFTKANSPNVSKCGKQAFFQPVYSNHLTVWIIFAWNGENHTATFNPPFVVAQYGYRFPANFGTWQVDNLSALGGPGGEWAFPYSPCP
jgi:hypothetical protein